MRTKKKVVKSGSGQCSRTKANAERRAEKDDAQPSVSLQPVLENVVGLKVMDRTVSAFGWPLAKFYRFMLCEWFYGHVDQPLYAEGQDEKREFSAMIRKYYSLLPNHMLNRVEWDYIRSSLRDVIPVRRVSSAFFLRERVYLERRREKVRFLMENQMFEYLDGDLPQTIPKPMDIGSQVRATIFTPRFGSCKGEVVGVEKQNSPKYRIRFLNDGCYSEHLLSDYRVAPEQGFANRPILDEITVTVKHLTQIVKLEKAIEEKFRMLGELETIRLNTTKGWLMRLGTTHPPMRDHELTGMYVNLVKKLVTLNRSISQLTKQVVNEYTQSMSEPLPTSDNMFLEDEVKTVGDQLMICYGRLQDNSPENATDLLWNAALHCLTGGPDKSAQLHQYIAHRFRTRHQDQAILN